MPPLPPLSGEPRGIEWKNEDGIIIGDEKYPLVFRISDLSDKFALIEFDMGQEYFGTDLNADYSAYVMDAYQVSYMDREIGLIGAVRKRDEPKENAAFHMFITTLERVKIPFALSVCGIPANADISDIIKFFPPDVVRESGSAQYGGLFLDDDGNEYSGRITVSDRSFILNIYSLKIDPKAHDKI
jgi:hypothetical protein